MHYSKIFSITCLLTLFYLFFINTIDMKTNYTNSLTAVNCNATNKYEKRGNPAYDKIKGNDRWHHYRVFFWVPKNATDFILYADANVRTDVSEHGPVENWTVLPEGSETEDEKLMFIYVPKTFVFLYGWGFEKVIHMHYK